MVSAAYRELKERAWLANMEIPRRGLAIYTFGNVSAFDRERGVLAIKPSGVAYERLAIDDMVVVDLEGKVVTTHADHLAEDVPCTEVMSDEAVKGDYETETGKQILDCFLGRNPLHTPMVLVAGHGPFTWGEDADKAVYNAVVLEEIAQMAFITRSVNPGAARLPDALVRKHFERKHGRDAYYGQK